MTSIRVSLSLALMALACGGESAARTDTSLVRVDSAVSTPPVAGLQPVSGQENPSDNPSQPTPAPWTVTEFGIGALRAGMTIAEGARMVGGSFSAPAPGSESCRFATWQGAPAGVTVMLDKGLIARVDVSKGVIATSKGARIGDTEARIKELYVDRVAVTPHEYTDGHYLTVTPAAGSGEDRSYRLVFETDGSRVTRYRGGKLPQVGWVEGCS